MSATRNVAPNPRAPESKAKGNDTASLKVFGAEIPLPHWAVSILAVFVLVFLPVFLYVGVKHIQADDHAAKESSQKVEDLTKANAELSKTNNDLADAKKRLQDAQRKEREANDNYQEFNKHSSESADWFHKDTKLIVTHYASDGCVSVVRPGVRATQWIKDPSLDPHQAPAPGRVDGGIHGGLATPPGPASEETGNASGIKLVRPKAAARLVMIDLHDTLAPGALAEFPPTGVHSLNGRCQDPHPGRYESWGGKTQGCWTQVWRKWADGCTHYQWFNSCSSSWDSEANGRPRVYWTACVH